MKNRGFTLIELLTTIALAAILLSMAVPGFKQVIQNNRSSTQANALVTALNLARSEAIKRGATKVSVCASTNGTSCAGSTNWATGWIVFTDGGTAGSVDPGPPANDVILRVWGALGGGSTFTGDVSFIQFSSLGPANAAATFTLTLPDCTGQNARTIAVSLTGQASTTVTNCP